MMPDIALVALLTFAIGIGFFLGVRRGTKSANALFPFIQRNNTYFEGLNYLLNEEPDKAVEAFIESLDVNAETLETHLALGKLMRKQGQVERAIRIHQNLLARPTLSIEHQHQAHLELARDFMSAGLLDRAELLLQEVIAESNELRADAQRYLLDIYQDEREWHEAIAIAEALLHSRAMKSNPGRRAELQQVIAQFYCELSVESSAEGKSAMARKHLERSLVIDKNCIRASILLATLDSDEGRARQAVKNLSKVASSFESHFTECLPELRRAYMLLDSNTGFAQFVDFVESELQRKPCTSALLYLVDCLVERAKQEPDRLQQAHDLLSSYLQRYASLAGLSKLVSMTLPAMEAELLEQAESGNVLGSQIRAISELLAKLLSNQMVYRCRSCGFAGRQLHWRCPTCKQWDKMDRLKELEAS